MLLHVNHSMVRLDSIWGVGGGRRPVKHLIKKVGNSFCSRARAVRFKFRIKLGCFIRTYFYKNLEGQECLFFHESAVCYHI